MHIIHGPTEIAGQMGIICQGLRKKGLKVSGYNWFNSYLKYQNNIINTDAYELHKIIGVIAESGDVIHFHNGNSFLTNFSDIPIYHAKGKKMVMHHWGNDVRTVAAVSKLNPYPLPPSYLDDVEIHRRLSFISKYIKTAIVQDFEVYNYVKNYYDNVHIVPLSCNVGNIKPLYPSVDETVPKIVHAPTNRDFKGSFHVEKAINQIKATCMFKYQVVEKQNHKKALSTYMNADIIIDQLMCGSYGMLSVEAMAMGKVVVAFIRDDVKEHIPLKLPIVNATPDTLSEVLISLVGDPQKRHAIGKKSRDFAMGFHHTDLITDKLLKIYRQL